MAPPIAPPAPPVSRELTFFDRTPPTSKHVPMFTISRSGMLFFNTGTVELLALDLGKPVQLVRDEATKRWYAHFGDVDGRKPARLRTDGRKKGNGLGFMHAEAARAFLAQFNVPVTRKSLALPLSTVPAVLQGLSLYGIDTASLGLPLAPVMPAEFESAAPAAGGEPEAAVLAPQEPAAAAVALPTEPEAEAPQPLVAKATEPEPVAETPTPEPSTVAVIMRLEPEQEAKATAERTSAEIMADRIRQEFPTANLGQLADALGIEVSTLRQKASKLGVYRAPSAPKMPAARTADKVASVPARVSVPKPAPAPVSVPKPDPAPTPAAADQQLPVAPEKRAPTQEEAESLAQHWYERELSLATERELAEILDVLGRRMASDRSFFEDNVLERAQKDQRRRLRKAA